MLEYLKYDENNVKTVSVMDGFHADMGMNIWVRILQPGQKLEFCSDTLETAVLLLAGRNTGNKTKPRPAPRTGTMRCPSCGSKADVRGGRWECPTCGDSGSRR